jgi:WD40 repeat protein
VGFAPDGFTQLTASADGTARIWNSLTGGPLAVLRGHQGTVTSAFSLDPRHVVTAGEDGTVRLWDAVTEPALRPLARFGRTINVARFDADGRRVRTWDERGLERVISATTGAVLASRNSRAPSVLVDRSPNGTVARARERAIVVRVPGLPARTLTGHRARVTSVALSRDGRLLATAARDNEVRVWDTRRMRMLWRLRVHFGLTSDARFSADGRWLVTAGPSRASLIYVPTGRFMFYLQGHRAPLTSASFDPTGRIVLTASRDGSVRTWRCDICGNLNELMELAKRRLASPRPR